MSDNFYEESDAEKHSIGEFFFYISLLIGSIWIAHNIFVAKEWQLTAFFRSLFEEIGDFFRVIFTGESHYVKEANFTWWVLPFCGLCYLAISCGIGVLKILEDILLNKRKVEERILAEYSSYRQFQEKFKDFNKLSKKAKKKVKGLFENGN
jgi:hypothetical protein